jgi:hypothetical protein
MRSPGTLQRPDDRGAEKLVVRRRNELSAPIHSAERSAQIERQLAADASL